MITVRMVQITPNSWKILAPNGCVLQSGIIANGVFEATEYVRKYISSWSDWQFEIILLKGNNNK